MGLKPREIRAMGPEDRAKALRDNRAELMHERGLAAMGGSVKNPGKIRDLRTSIARLLTIERELGEVGGPPLARPAKAPAKPAAKAAKPPARAAKPAAKAAKPPAKAKPAAAKPAAGEAGKAKAKSSTASKGGAR